MNLKVTFSVFIGLIVFVVLTIFSTLVLSSRVNEVQNELKLRDSYVADKASQELVFAFGDYYYYQYDTYLEIVKDFTKRYPDILGFVIYSDVGEVMFDTKEIQTKEKAYGQKVENKKLLKIIADQKAVQEVVRVNGQDVIRIYFPYFDKFDIYRNMVVFDFSLSKVRQTVQQSILFFAGALFLFSTLSIAATVFLVDRVLKPISDLTKVSAEITKGNYDKTVVVSDPKNEVGILATTFNQMIGEIKKSKQSLEEYNKELESQVEERTKELEQRIVEMQKLQKLTVGRELKMVELKEENRQLKERLGLKSEPAPTTDTEAVSVITSAIPTAATVAETPEVTSPATIEETKV